MVKLKPGPSPGRTLRTKGTYSPLGLDIGSACTKLIQFKQGRGKLAVQGAALLPTPGGCLEGGRLVDSDALCTCLQALGQKAPWRGRRLHLSLPAGAFFLRRVKLPPLSPREKRQAMRWEMEKSFPLDAAESVFDYCPTGKENASTRGEKEYLLAALPRRDADAYTTAVMKAGFIPAALDIAPLALLHSLKAADWAKEGEPPAVRVLLDIGFSSSLLVISERNAFAYSRSLQGGIRHLYGALQENGSAADQRAAHARLFSPGRERQETLAAPLSSLSAQVQQSLEYWLENRTPTRVHPVLLEICGGGALVPGLGRTMSAALRLPVAFPGGMSSGHDPGSQPARRVLYCAAAGLALRGWLR